MSFRDNWLYNNASPHVGRTTAAQVYIDIWGNWNKISVLVTRHGSDIQCGYILCSRLVNDFSFDVNMMVSGWCCRTWYNVGGYKIEVETGASSVRISYTS